MPQLGEEFELGAWFLPGGKKTAKAQVEVGFRRAREQHGLRFSHITWEDKAPGEDRVPEAEKDAPQGSRMVVGTARIVEILPPVETKAATFVGDLSAKELGILRAATRRGHQSARPSDPLLTDDQCDAVIEQMGPVAAENVIREVVNAR